DSPAKLAGRVLMRFWDPPAKSACRELVRHAVFTFGLSSGASLVLLLPKPPLFTHTKTSVSYFLVTILRAQNQRGSKQGNRPSVAPTTRTVELATDSCTCAFRSGLHNP